MGRSGTEVTKQAADFVITDDNFATIVEAIEEGRGLYRNIQRTLEYLLSGNLVELLLIGVVIAAGLPSPLLPVQLLWLNLVTDGLPAIALAHAKPTGSEMTEPPRSKSRSLLDGRFWLSILPVAIIGALGGLALAIYFRGSIEVHTYLFAYLVYFETIRSLFVGSTQAPFWRTRMTLNKPLIVVVFATLLFQIWTHHNGLLTTLFKTTTISIEACGLLILYSLACVMLIELLKLRPWVRLSSSH
jgi:P-type Ca2+ transporter type 2C